MTVRYLLLCPQDIIYFLQGFYENFQGVFEDLQGFYDSKIVIWTNEIIDNIIIHSVHLTIIFTENLSQLIMVNLP